ncbi:MAG: alpha/beta fold hydrolase, partial [Candidatus Electrothrix sp.]
LYTLPNPLPETYSSVPIGRPTADSKLYILNAEYQIQPFGIAGELCIAGESLARGYLNRPELTEQQFVTLELFGEQQRVYKTGDLARWLPDGNIEYIGRVDNQIKLRGFRIELGEIEAVLCQHEAVSEAVVLLRGEDEDGRQLVAYLTVRCPLETQAMRSWLQQHLPDHMIPAAFCVVETMPIAPSGKIDRKVLAVSEVSNGAQEERKFARDAVELQLISIWEAVLNQSKISIHDNFFELGGHSLLALQLMAKIHQHFDLKLSVSSLFKSPTVAELAEQLREGRTDDSSCLIPLRSGERGKGVMLLLPEATGSVMYFHSFVSSLGGIYPVYALQSPGLDGRHSAIGDLKELAFFHLQNIRQQQVVGPYILVGHSSGGRVAYELARLLEQEGEAVQVLAILDTYAPNSPPEHDDMDNYNEYNWLYDIVYAFETTQQTDVNISLQDLEAFEDLEEAYGHVMEVFRQHNIFAPNTSLDELKAMVNVYRLTCQADRSYAMPGKLHCPIHLFCASESINNFGGLSDRKSVTQGWPECTDAEIREHWVGGNHMSMMFQPHVESMAVLLSESLESVIMNQGESNEQ